MSKLATRVDALERRTATEGGQGITAIYVSRYGHEAPETCQAALLERARLEHPERQVQIVDLFETDRGVPRCRACGKTHEV